MNINDYIETLNKRYRSGISSEHSYRADLENLIKSLAPDVDMTNEPLNVTDCGNPDFVVMKKGIPVGYIEAKDIGKDLKSKSYKEQFDRYRKALDNLIITDYLWFRFYNHGELIHEIRIAEIQGNQVVPLPENVAAFSNLVKDFCTFVGQTIKSAQRLARMMAGKARLLQNTLEKAATSDEHNQENTSLQEQLKAFKDVLIHDITPREFADIYAQTLAYGMFAARLHDPTLEDFSRQEAASLIPKTNPFLRKLFQYIAGYDIDDRIRITVDNLAEVFRATDVKALLQNFGKATQQNDPIIHFYETFLAEYDPKLRKSRGVWYTPEPVVNFIVRAVDDILKNEFGIADGLADTSKTTVDIKVQTLEKRGGKKAKTISKTEKKEVHRVQILDPATGTGTFLAEIIKHIYNTRFQHMQGVWSSYVENDLIPRLNGFELLMASYAMAHLKLDLLLAETGYKPTKDQRFRVFLTNSLEEYHPDTGTLFASWLSQEANEANHIKRDTPVMVVLGNPPYSGISSNMGEWIVNLIEDYKYVDGEHFRERKHWLQDDYVKFIRYGEHFVDKNGEGVLAYINNHSFLDNPTFRGMRWHLLKTFDKIYIIDLHGNAKKKEVTPDGSLDQNVFDIQQGVSINIFVKTGFKEKNQLAKVLHADLWGDRKFKYDQLLKRSLINENFEAIQFSKPYCFFTPKDFGFQKNYLKGFGINDFFKEKVTGVITARDSLVIGFNKTDLLERIEDFSNPTLNDNEARIKFFGSRNTGRYPAGDTRGWKVPAARKAIINLNHLSYIKLIDYRPFDYRYIYYHTKMVDWGRHEFMNNFLARKNFGLMTCRQTAIDRWEHVGITKYIADDSRVSNRTRERGYIFPMYLYPNSEQDGFLAQNTRQPNFDQKIIDQIAKKLKLRFVSDHELPEANTPGTFHPLDVLDYIYAVLHSPTYRKKYKEFLKIDFPRVPFPSNEAMFRRLVALGGELRQIHLLESPRVSQHITEYPQNGDNSVAKGYPKYKGNRVYINEAQYFEGVPQIAWEFYIGGYQPAQKWLKDRRTRTLSYDDISHYQKIIVALTETDRIMKKIDNVWKPE